MARHKEFDREVVLEKAMATFWRYGYEGTSVQTLVENMGINRGSIYDTFGDKRSLFLAAIQHYNEAVVKKLIVALEAPGASKQVIIDRFYNLIDRAVADKDRKGCLLVNTAVEVCPHDADTASQIAADFKRIENAFKKALSRAQEKGELGGDRDVTALARYLTCNLQGLRVISKVNPDPKFLRDIAKVALSALD
ncbi:MAG: TetR/AcrR family transcriptional regulator [Prochloraceae cyanobacterium]|nr:TetR/AcrR family transcriptional regulator [Prochloraceae cyanobacterium]